MRKGKRTRLEQVRENVKSNIVESLELPADIVYGAVIVTAMGRGQVLVENYKGIIEYYTNEEMKITGCIQGILYDS